MAYAIIEMGGRQFRVEEGDSVLVDRLDAKQGTKLAPRTLAFADSGQAVVEPAEAAKVKVEAVVAGHLKGDKVRVFKYRPKKRYRQTSGHRALLTRIEITGIKGPSGARPAAKQAEAKAPAKRAPAKKAAAKKATTKKATTKKATTKKAATKKATTKKATRKKPAAKRGG